MTLPKQKDNIPKRKSEIVTALQIPKSFLFFYVILSYNSHYQHIQKDADSICKLIFNKLSNKEHRYNYLVSKQQKWTFYAPTPSKSIQLLVFFPTKHGMTRGDLHGNRHRDLSGWPVVHGPSAKASLVGGPGRTSPVTKRKRRVPGAKLGLVGGGPLFMASENKKRLKRKKQDKTRLLYRKRNVFLFFVVRKMRTAGFCWGLFKLTRTSVASLVFWRMCFCSHWSNTQVVQV